MTHMKTERTYTHQFAQYSAEGDIIALSGEFVFQKMQVEFAAGIVEKNGKFIISYGVQDESSHFASIPVEKVLEILKPVKND